VRAAWEALLSGLAVDRKPRKRSMAVVGAAALGVVVLIYLKSVPLLDPLRKDPRFQAIERALKFPD
jgi:hypothetical protein